MEISGLTDFQKSFTEKFLTPVQKKFQKNSEKVQKKFQKNSEKVQKKFQKNSGKIPKKFPKWHGLFENFQIEYIVCANDTNLKKCRITLLTMIISL